MQRINEIETYRLMALLALPIARDMIPTLDGLEAELASVMRKMDADPGSTDDPSLLLALTNLAVRVEALSAQGHRFSAAQAYDRLVLARIGELREQRIEGVPTIGEFMERRLSPAMDTCRSIKARQVDLATRVARAIDLLRTRVNLVQERQTNGLLKGMNLTARTQLQLQHAVEGLSVVAISYYAFGLLSAFVRPLNGGVEWSAIAKSLAVPAVVLGVYFSIRRMRGRLGELS